MSALGGDDGFLLITVGMEDARMLLERVILLSNILSGVEGIGSDNLSGEDRVGSDNLDGEDVLGKLFVVSLSSANGCCLDRFGNSSLYSFRLFWTSGSSLMSG